MPDQPGKGPPSSAPLSVEDADRLADRFTAIWEGDGEVGPLPPAPLEPAATSTAPVVGPATSVSPIPSPSTAPPATAPTAGATRPLAGPDKPIVRQTLLGIAPLTAPSTRPHPSPAANSVSTPPTSANVEATVSGAVTQPLPVVVAPEPLSEGESTPEAAARKARLLADTGGRPASRPRAASPPAPAVKSSPNVTGYAIAHTPKDGPSTPAVVIAPEAQSSPETSKRIFSQTVPSRVRAAEPPPDAAPSADAFEPYAPKKSKGKLAVLAVAGALALAFAIALVRTREQPSPAAPTAVDTSNVAAIARSAASEALAPPAATPTSMPTRATADAAPAASSAGGLAPEASARAETATAASEPAQTAQVTPAKAKGKAKAAPPTRTPTSRPPNTPVPPEASPAAARPATSKGVIVRDAPF